MQISRKSDYAVRALAYIASRRGRRVLIAEVAQAMTIPAAFLAKILKQLTDAGLVISQPGRGGGYELARSATAITFREVIEAVEGPWSLVPCQTEDPLGCSMAEMCSQAPIWDDIRRQIVGVLDGYTLDRVKAPSMLPVLPSPVAG